MLLRVDFLGSAALSVSVLFSVCYFLSLPLPLPLSLLQHGHMVRLTTEKYPEVYLLYA